jgi:predicted PurR-regulated permease PerM
MEAGTVRIDTPGQRSMILDSALRIGMVAILVYACTRILVPFVGVLLWSAILAVMLYPLHLKLVKRLGNRWSAVLIGAVGVSLLLVPMVIAVMSLGNSIFTLVQGIQNHTLVVPPAPPRLAGLPFIGPKIVAAWTLVATNTPAALVEYGPQLKKIAGSMAAFGGGLAGGVFSFILSLAIAAVLVAYGASSAAFAQDLGTRITGSTDRAARLVSLTAATIRGVAQGVVGVAVVQAVLIGIGFFAIGIPAAGLLTLVALLLGIVQVPAMLITLPAIGYIFSVEATTPAIIFAIYTFVAGLSDNILKPLMLGRGLEVPMPVILIGVIGGMLTDGLLGLFVGPVVLAVGYMLFIDWVKQPPVATIVTET